jgi:hypothetical protein
MVVAAKCLMESEGVANLFALMFVWRPAFRLYSLHICYLL